MGKRGALQDGVFTASALALAVLTAALFSHVLIDLVGDVVLAHDTYDGLGHGSRSDVLVLGLTIMAAALLWVARGAVRQLRGQLHEVRPSIGLIVGLGFWPCAFATAVLTLLTVAAMEAGDLTSGGVAIDGIADLFGGSIVLGGAITATVAALCAGIARALARALHAAQSALAGAIGRLIALVTRAAGTALLRIASCDSSAELLRESILARRRGKRGPPVHLS